MSTLKWLLSGFVCVGLVGLSIGDANAQRSSRNYDDNEPAVELGGTQVPRRLIDNPTAGTLARGSFDTEMRAYPNGGVLGVLQIGLTNSWMVGIAYGGTGIIANHAPDWNPRIQFLTKIQLIGETVTLPGFALGYEDLGFGQWIDSLDRYETKSKGFFAVASKGYAGSGFVSAIHAGVNYSTETDDNDENFNLFFGGDMRFENHVGLVAEYDLALNDDRKPLSQGAGYGYLNAGVRWEVLDRLLVEFNLKDITSNRRHTSSIGRELRLIYVESF